MDILNNEIKRVYSKRKVSIRQQALEQENDCNQNYFNNANVESHTQSNNSVGIAGITTNSTTSPVTTHSSQLKTHINTESCDNVDNVSLKYNSYHAISKTDERDNNNSVNDGSRQDMSHFSENCDTEGIEAAIEVVQTCLDIITHATRSSGANAEESLSSFGYRSLPTSTNNTTIGGDKNSTSSSGKSSICDNNSNDCTDCVAMDTVNSLLLTDADEYRPDLRDDDDDDDIGRVAGMHSWSPQNEVWWNKKIGSNRSLPNDITNIAPIHS